jgi:hypothetical protein
MSSLKRFGLVIGGYGGACLIAGSVVYVNQLSTDSAASQASAGMSAFGDLILFIVIFGILALFPTGVALYFLIRKLLMR